MHSPISNCDDVRLLCPRGRLEVRLVHWVKDNSLASADKRERETSDCLRGTRPVISEREGDRETDRKIERECECVLVAQSLE